MIITKRDLFIIAGIALILVILIIGGTRNKGHQVPGDERHRPFIDAVGKGLDREATEKGCVTCHNPQSRPLPKNHPPKEQCLICHKIK
jgi:hypothetical protein